MSRKYFKAEEELKATHWQRLPGLRQANFNRARSKKLINLSKISLKALTGFLTGHCRLREHLRTLGLEEDSTCRFCGEEPETPHLILLECYAVQKIKHTGITTAGCGRNTSNRPTQILKFLKELHLEGLLWTRKPWDSRRRCGTIDLIRSQYICHHPHLPLPMLSRSSQFVWQKYWQSVKIYENWLNQSIFKIRTLKKWHVS